MGTTGRRSRILRESAPGLGPNESSMSDNGSTGPTAPSPSAPSASAGSSGETSGLDATVPVSSSDPSSSDPAVEATVRIAGSGPAAGISPSTSDPAESATGQGVTDDLCGRTLQHFKVIERIGVGGMGSVYRAHDLSLDRTVALKVIRAEKVAASAQRERFIREARSQARLSHPNVVPIYYIGEEEGLLFFAMELVDGEPLDRMLARGERLEWPRALELLHDVADALRMAHERGIVHRDIKPSNLLVDGSGMVKVADFGLAKSVTGDESVDVQLTQQGTVLGSPLYMSPEQGQGEAVDHRSDIYSLGAAIYHLLTGRPPFEAKSPVGVIAKHMSAPVPRLLKEAPNVPEGVARLVERMLAKDPADRFEDYETLQRAVRAAFPNAAAPAGFFVRGMAFVVDVIPMTILITLFDVLGIVLASAYVVLGWWRFGKTFGKWLFKLRVRTVENEPLSLGRAFLRSVAWSWAWILFAGINVISRVVFGVWGVGGGGPTYARAPGLALALAILSGLIFLAYLIGLLWAGFRSHKRAWHDLVSGTMVVYHLPSAPGSRGAGDHSTTLGPISRSGSRDP